MPFFASVIVVVPWGFFYFLNVEKYPCSNNNNYNDVLLSESYGIYPISSRHNNYITVSVSRLGVVLSVCPNGTRSCAAFCASHIFFIITRKCGMRAGRINYMPTTARASRWRAGRGGVRLQDGSLYYYYIYPQKRIVRQMVLSCSK